MNEPFNEGQARDHIVDLLTIIDALHTDLTEAEAAILHDAALDAQLLVRDWVAEDLSLADGLRQGVHLLRQRVLVDQLDAIISNESTISTKENTTMTKTTEPRELTPLELVDQRVEDHNRACDEAAAAWRRAARALSAAESDRGPHRRPDDVQTLHVTTPGPGAAARVGELREALKRAQDAMDETGRARNRYLASLPYRGLRPAGYLQREFTARLDAERQRQLQRDLEALGVAR